MLDPGEKVLLGPHASHTVVNIWLCQPAMIPYVVEIVTRDMHIHFQNKGTKTTWLHYD